MARLFLNMICRNEVGRIERALDSVAQFVDGMTILDTGSTDGTPEKIEEYCRYHRIYLRLNRGEFIDFSQARNDALRMARMDDEIRPNDYLLLMDADMQLVVKDRSVFDKMTGQSYDALQEAGGLLYGNRRFLRKNTTAMYLGKTHEYLDVESTGCLEHKSAFFVDHADGSNRPEKYARDIRLLLEGLKEEPLNVRYYYYLAQSYRDAGQLDKAIHWYRKRINAGGWPEEVWSAQENMALCYRAMGNEAEFIRNMLIAYNERPSRAEIPYQLANHFRTHGMNQLGAMFAAVAMRIPKSRDLLFVNEYAYGTGPLEEMSICGFYTEDHKNDGFMATNMLALGEMKYPQARELARNNMFHYLHKLKDVCPSAELIPLPFTPEVGWQAMNPSIVNHMGVMDCVVRTVNYTMDNDGRYLIQDVTGQKEASNDNPINTRNFLVTLSNDFKIKDQRELKPHGEFPPPAYKAVIGFEDMRLFTHNGALWTSSNVREQNPQGMCEQIRARIGAYGLTDFKKLIRHPQLHEKNWMPINDRPGMEWMYRLGEVVNDEALTIVKHPYPLDIGQISGGTQLIPFDGDWLCLVHEARPLPDKHWKRYYWHRFVLFSKDFKVKFISVPFIFEEKQIEFAAGLCWHPDGKRLVISLGIRDCLPYLCTVTHNDVWKLIWSHSKS